MSVGRRGFVVEQLEKHASNRIQAVARIAASLKPTA